MRLASHKRLFDPQLVVFQLFVRILKTFLLCNCIFCFTPPIFCSCVVEYLFWLFHLPFASPLRLKTFFCSLTHRWQLLGCFFPQVALLIKVLPTLKLPSSRSLIYNNDSHIVRFLRSLKLCCLDAKPQCYLLCASA